jgi:hypothetical protein
MAITVFCFPHSYRASWYYHSFISSPTDAPVNCVKNNIKIDIKTALTCFSAVTPSSGGALLVLAKVTVVKIAYCGRSVCGDVPAYIGVSLLVCVRCTVRK